LLLDLQTGGVSQVKISKTAALTIGAGNAKLEYTPGSALTLKRSSDGGSTITLNPEANLITTGSFVPTVRICNTALTASVDFNDGANTFAVRNGTNAQTFNVYGTYTSGSVYERMFAKYDGTALAFQVGTQHVGASARPLQLLTDNTARMTIGTTGNVGIGTTAPAAPLHIQNIAGLTTLGSSNSLIISGRQAGSTVGERQELNFKSWNGFSGSTASLGIITTSTASFELADLYFAVKATAAGTSPTEVMRITSGGNVGIGTTAPTASLEIRATAIVSRESLIKATVSDAGNDAFHIYNATGAANVFAPGFSASTFSTNTGGLIFTSQTTAANDTGTGPLMFYSARITDSQTDPNNGSFSAVSTRPLFAWVNHNTNLMQMSANGNLGIGTTAPSSKLQVSAGDVEVDTIAKGVILKSPDGTRYRVTVANGGTLSVAAV